MTRRDTTNETLVEAFHEAPLHAPQSLRVPAGKTLAQVRREADARAAYLRRWADRIDSARRIASEGFVAARGR